MEFSIEFFKTYSDNCPVRDFLDDLKRKDPDDFAIILAGLTKLRNRDYHRPPLSKPIGEELFELRHLGKLNTRIVYFFGKGKRIIAVHGIQNKTQKIPKADLNIAKARREDWERRNKI
jgi:phage-related protein